MCAPLPPSPVPTSRVSLVTCIIVCVCECCVCRLCCVAQLLAAAFVSLRFPFSSLRIHSLLSRPLLPLHISHSTSHTTHTQLIAHCTARHGVCRTVTSLCVCCVAHRARGGSEKRMRARISFGPTTHNTTATNEQHTSLHNEWIHHQLRVGWKTAVVFPPRCLSLSWRGVRWGEEEGRGDKGGQEGRLTPYTQHIQHANNNTQVK